MNVSVGLLPPRAGSVEVFGTPVTRLPPETIAARGVALVPQGRRIFKSLTVRENLMVAAHGLCRRPPRAVDRRHGVRHVPAACRAARPDRRLPVRRRAADARDRPRADGQSARAVDGRAVGGPGAADRRRGHGDDPQAQGRAASRSCWSSRARSSSSTSPTISSSSTAAASRWRRRPRRSRHDGVDLRQHLGVF